MDKDYMAMPDDSQSPLPEPTSQPSHGLVFGLGIAVITLGLIGFSGYQYWSQLSQPVDVVEVPAIEVPETEEEKVQRQRAEMIALLDQEIAVPEISTEDQDLLPDMVSAAPAGLPSDSIATDPDLITATSSVDDSGIADTATVIPVPMPGETPAEPPTQDEIEAFRASLDAQSAASMDIAGPAPTQTDVPTIESNQ